MLALVNVILFVGYLLVYAAIAHRGRYAKKPWDAIREPAGGSSSSSPGVAGAGSSSGSSGLSRGLGVLGDAGKILLNLGRGPL